jgi:hypothetical protein
MSNAHVSGMILFRNGEQQVFTSVRESEIQELIAAIDLHNSTTVALYEFFDGPKNDATSVFYVVPEDVSLVRVYLPYDYNE